MAIAVFTDIHGNLEALEAILKDIKRNHKIKETYFLGDAVTFGPDSSACLKLLEKEGVKCVVGNHEQRLFRYEKSIARMSQGGVEHMTYIFNSLDNDDIRFIKSMPLERTLEFKGFKLYFAHYCYDEDGVVQEDFDCFREDLLDKLFAKSDCDAVFFGHLHARKIYIRNGARSYFCLESSGCVSGDRTQYTYFDMNSFEDGNYDIYRISVKYNRAKFEEKMRTLPIPEKETFAKRFFGVEL